MAEDGVNAREFGHLEATVDSLRSELKEHKRESKEAIEAATAKIDELLALANKGKGAWFASMAIAAGVSSMLTFAIKYFSR